MTVLEPATDDWIERLAKVYRDLRIATIVDVRPVEMNGITIADTSCVQSLMAEQLVPPHGTSNFNVVRSDLAEVVLGLLGEVEHASRYGFRAARDRELVRLPGRGPDALGVEGDFENDPAAVEPRVVVGEAKTSSALSVPGVVDSHDDSLRKQHVKHTTDPHELGAKLLQAAKFARDPGVGNDLMAAAISYLDGRGLPIVCSSVLIRPSDRAVLPADLGSFFTDHAGLLPACIRFYVLVVPGGIAEVVAMFGDVARGVRDITEEVS